MHMCNYYVDIDIYRYGEEVSFLIDSYNCGAWEV